MLRIMYIMLNRNYIEMSERAHICEFQFQMGFFHHGETLNFQIFMRDP